MANRTARRSRRRKQDNLLKKANAIFSNIMDIIASIVSKVWSAYQGMSPAKRKGALIVGGASISVLVFMLVIITCIVFYFSRTKTNAEPIATTNGKTRTVSVQLISNPIPPEFANKNAVPGFETPCTEYVLGAMRPFMNGEQLKCREEAKFREKIFFVLTNKKILEGIPKVLPYKEIIEAQYKKVFDDKTLAKFEAKYGYKLNPEELKNSALWITLLESQGNPLAVSYSNRTGLTQINPPDAKLLVEALKKAGKLDWENVDLTDPNQNYRLYYEFLLTNLLHYGRLEYALAAHHIGQTRLDDWLQIYIEEAYGQKVEAKNVNDYIKEKSISYSDLYFRNTPYYNAKSYKQFEFINSKDGGPEYYFKVICGGRILSLYDKHKDIFSRLLKEQKVELVDSKDQDYEVDATGKVRFHTWLSERDSQKYKTLSDLDDKDLLSVPDKPEELGYDLITNGIPAQTIAQWDKKNQSKYLVLNLAAKSTLASIGTHYLAMRGPRETPAIMVSSLVRTVDYQKTLQKSNGQAAKDIMSHCNGSSFDFIKPTDPDQWRDLRFIIREHGSVSDVSDAPEGNGTIHLNCATGIKPVNSKTITVDSNGKVN